MGIETTPRPLWLTFDCYGTLIQWDEGLVAAVEALLARRSENAPEAARFLAVFDRHEHRLEQLAPHRSFRDVTGESLRLTMQEFGLEHRAADSDALIASVSAMPPHPEVPAALAELKAMGFRLCIVSNTDDDIIAGNVAQLGGSVDRVVTAQQARAYKPSRRIFEFAHGALGVAKEDVVHICASPHLDLAAARDMNFRCIWIDRGSGRKPLPDYTPDAVFPTLDRVPEAFRQWGWG